MEYVYRHDTSVTKDEGEFKSFTAVSSKFFKNTSKERVLIISVYDSANNWIVMHYNMDSQDKK